jgi:hypothetical protein
VTGLLLVLLLVGLPLASLFGDLCHRDLERSRAIAEAALRRAMEDPGTSARDASRTGSEDIPERSPWWLLEGVEADHRTGQHG